ncbi:MAG: S8 family serine peptidase [Candidatus Kariarchaeaceae archaeon]|jgi:subtilisin family serine protease
MKRNLQIILLFFILISSLYNYDQGNLQLDSTLDFVNKINPMSKDLTLSEIIQKNSAKVDNNNNKIADYLEHRQGIIDGIILFENFNVLTQKFAFKGITVLDSYESLPALHVSFDSKLLNLISNMPGVAVIEENKKLEPYLAYSTSQLGVRPYLWDEGLTGSGDYSIAVVDSGIDFTHSAFENRIIASYNALDDNATLAEDDDGHGTHVAGIAAGLSITQNTYSQTSRGKLPDGPGFFADILWANVNVTSSITVGMDWGSKGVDTPGGEAYVVLVEENLGGFRTPIGCTCQVLDTTGYIESTFTNIAPGDYYVGFGNENGANNIDYEGWAELSYDSEIPSQQAIDGYEEYSGVAPDANIVAVKVINNAGDGTTSTFIDAMDWVLANKDTYNITVVNLSLGIDVVDATMDSEVAVLANNGIITVVAAGNDGKDSGGIYSPGSAEEAITVGAVNRFNEIAGYSSNGKITSEATIAKPDVVAPGGSHAYPFLSTYSHDSSYTEGLGLIVAPDSNTIGVNEQIDDLTGQQGTSMASPHIAGLALLLMETYADENGWQWNSADVFRIKRAILAGTSEVVNIGSAGGETVEFPDQIPIHDSENKDLVEGWGLVNAQAALGALDGAMILNQDIIKRYSLEDPFVPNVYAWTTTLDAGSDYSFQATVPVGADVDLLVFESNVGNYGDLQLIDSSINGKSVNEQITLNPTQSKEVMLVVRLVDSDNLIDDITIKLTNPDFIPFVKITYPADGSYVNTATVNVEFESVTNTADAYINDASVGIINSGDALPALTEGSHNLTLVEENINIGQISIDQSNFTLDLTSPTINSNITLLDSQSVEDPVTIEFDVDDDLILDRVELRANGVLGVVQVINSKPFTGQLVLDPRIFLPGVKNVELTVFDKAGNFDTISVVIDLIHNTFLIPQTDYNFEKESEFPLSLTWVAGTNQSLNYLISIDNIQVVDEIWDGGNIVYEVPDLDLGDHAIKLQVFDVNGKSASDEIIISVIDTIAPRIAELSSTMLDATYTQTIEFDIEEALPASIRIYLDDVEVQAKSPWDGDETYSSLPLTGIPNESNDIRVEVTDTSSNSEEYSVTINWIDGTPAKITSPSPIEFKEGSAPDDLRWDWEEKFVIQVTLSLDKDIIVTITDSSVSSLQISKNELNKLNSGVHTFELIVSDSSGNNFASEVRVTVSKKSGNGGISGFSLIPAILSVLISINILKRRNSK